MKRWQSAAIIDVHTWNKDSHGLFDYESGSISRQALKTFRSVKIFRTHDSIQLIPDVSNPKKMPEHGRLLGYLHEQDGVYTLSRENILMNPSEQKVRDDFWLVVKTLKTKDNDFGYRLKRNDVMKLGRAKFRIRDIIKDHQQEEEKQNINLANTETISPNKEEESNIDFLHHYVAKPMPENSEISCRICLFNDNEVENPLVSPCGCSGSVQHIHIDCLKLWMKSKCIRKDNAAGYIQYVWKKIVCELCHKMLPDIFVKKTGKVELIDIERPKFDCIILETLPRESQDSKSFYVIPAVPGSITKLGRGHEVNIRMNDISVSRYHASINFVEGGFYLHDNASKFGTSILIKTNYILSPDQNPGVQIGRSLFFITAIANKNFDHPKNISDALSVNKPINIPQQVPPPRLEAQEEFEPLCLTEDLLQFSFQNPAMQRVQRLPNVFEIVDTDRLNETVPAEVPLAQQFDTQMPILDYNMFQLSIPKDVPMFPNQGWFREQTELRQDPMNSNNQGRRRKRDTIADEMEKLGISNENNDTSS